MRYLKYLLILFIFLVGCEQNATAQFRVRGVDFTPSAHDSIGEQISDSLANYSITGLVTFTGYVVGTGWTDLLIDGTDTLEVEECTSILMTSLVSGKSRVDGGSLGMTLEGFRTRNCDTTLVRKDPVFGDFSYIYMQEEANYSVRYLETNTGKVRVQGRAVASDTLDLKVYMRYIKVTTE